jgi:hypothetical protein
MPRKLRKERRKPPVMSTQKILLTIRRVGSLALGSSHERAGMKKPRV